MISADDIRQFNLYLQQCTTPQVVGVIEKEREAGRHEYVALAERELEVRREREAAAGHRY